MKYAQVAAELKAKDELDNVIQMLEQMGQIDYVLYTEDQDEEIEDPYEPTWCRIKEVTFDRVPEGLHAMILDNYEGMNPTPCLVVNKENSYLAPARHEFEYEVWETEMDAGKSVKGSPFNALMTRVNFTTLYTLCPEVFDQELLPPGNESIGKDYWFVPKGLGLNYEVGLELLAACRAA